jgi:hypothetical protein
MWVIGLWRYHSDMVSDHLASPRPLTPVTAVSNLHDIASFAVGAGAEPTHSVDQ